MPEGKVICLGDLHPGNIVLTEYGPMILDWVNASTAPPAADVARTLMLIGYQGMTTDASTEFAPLAANSSNPTSPNIWNSLMYHEKTSPCANPSWRPI